MIFVHKVDSDRITPPQTDNPVSGPNFATKHGVYNQWLREGFLGKR